MGWILFIAVRHTHRRSRRRRGYVLGRQVNFGWQGAYAGEVATGAVIGVAAAGIEKGAGAAMSRAASAAAASGIIGRYSPSPNLKFGTGLFGDEAHANAAPMITQQLRAQGVTGIIDRTRPGMKGVDLEVPKEFVEKLGFKYKDIKPNSASGLAKLNRQIARWGYDPSTVRAVTYDAKGNVYWGFDF